MLFHDFPLAWTLDIRRESIVQAILLYLFRMSCDLLEKWTVWARFYPHSPRELSTFRYLMRLQQPLIISGRLSRLLLPCRLAVAMFFSPAACRETLRPVWANCIWHVVPSVPRSVRLHASNPDRSSCDAQPGWAPSILAGGVLAELPSVILKRS